MLPNNIKIVNHTPYYDIYQLDKNTNPLDKDWYFFISGGTMAILCDIDAKKHNLTDAELKVLKETLYPELSYNCDGYVLLHVQEELDEESMLWSMAGNPYRRHVWKVKEGTFYDDRIADFWERIKSMNDGDQIKSEFLNTFGTTMDALNEFHELTSALK